MARVTGMHSARTALPRSRVPASVLAACHPPPAHAQAPDHGCLHPQGCAWLPAPHSNGGGEACEQVGRRRRRPVRLGRLGRRRVEERVVRADPAAASTFMQPRRLLQHSPAATCCLLFSPAPLGSLPPRPFSSAAPCSWLSPPSTSHPPPPGCQGEHQEMKLYSASPRPAPTSPACNQPTSLPPAPRAVDPGCTKR